MSQHTSKTTTDHEEIRRWAEERHAKPSCVKGTGGGEDPGMIRLDFPGYTGKQKLDEITWDEWFQKFDENGLALVFQEETAGGEKSNFNKLVRRGNEHGSGDGKREAKSTPSRSGGSNKTSSSGSKSSSGSGKSSRGKASAK